MELVAPRLDVQSGMGLPANVQGTAAYGKKSWMTETSGEAADWLSPASGFPNQGAWSIALKLHQALTVGQQSGWASDQFTDGNPIGASTLTDATQRSSATKYVAAKHFFHFIRPNSVRVIAAVANAPSLNASAYLAPSNTALTVVLVNSDTSPVAVQVTAPSLPAGLTSFQSFTSDANALWVSKSVPIVSGATSVTVPGYGVCTLFGQPVSVPIPPAIIQLPQSTNVSAGTNVSFSCAATGDVPLGFQWLFNNLPIAGATSTTLVLTNAQPFQAGQYAVQVTNSAGSLTSFPANLGVSGPGTLPIIPLKLSVVRFGESLQLSFQANRRVTYSWLVSTNLNSWSFATQFVSVGGPAQWLVPPSAPAQYVPCLEPLKTEAPL